MKQKKMLELLDSISETSNLVKRLQLTPKEIALLLESLEVLKVKTWKSYKRLQTKKALANRQDLLS